MRLHRLKINGFRRIQNAEVLFGDATFLIGANNVGKSTVLRAIDRILSAEKSLDQKDYFSVIDHDTGETKPQATTVTLEAEFRGLPDDAEQWMGFKGRVFEVEEGAKKERAIFYRKTYAFGKDVVVELKQLKKTLKAEFAKATKAHDLIAGGVDEAAVLAVFDTADKKLAKGWEAKASDIDELWDVSDEVEWFTNPGGIPGNVLVRLPTFLMIPADTSSNHIDDKSGDLNKTLGDLFELVRDGSENYKNAQKLLNDLAKELDPADKESEFGKMLHDLNDVLSGVFPDSLLHVSADLSDPNKALKPTFSVHMSSNVRTTVDCQGNGMIRSAVFGVLRYRQRWIARKNGTHTRSLIIGFEEPEIYLHPSAAAQMRETIYLLSEQTSQIVATTHSPYMIDLSRKPKQVLNRICLDAGSVAIHAFNVTSAFEKLQEQDSDYVKMLLKIDDHIARVFFAQKVIVVEGDTEDIVIRQTLKCLASPERLRIAQHCQVVKARGKAAIIGLVKYLTSMGIFPTVIHDLDSGVPGALVMNAPIGEAAKGGTVIPLKECVEDVLGYSAPTREKPAVAYQETLKWNDKWDSVPQPWREVMLKAFAGYLDETVWS